MEKKNNNGMLVGILIGIIIMLLVFICLFVTGTISFKTSTITNTEETSESQINNIETEKTITKDEAVNILKKAADRIGNVSNGYPYCGENMNYDDTDAIFDEHNISTHNASKDYTSLDNMKEDLKKYMSEELINKYIDNSNYIEKNQKLYCKTYHKGTILYDSNKSSYTVETFTNDEIIANGTLSTFSEGDNYYNNKVNIEMKKNNDNWQITKYEIEK